MEEDGAQASSSSNQQQQQQQQHCSNNNNKGTGRSLHKKMETSSSFSLRSPSLNMLRLRRIFDVFDKNGDGIITVDELSRALNLLGLEADLSELQSTVSSFIRPGKPGLSFEDFEALHVSLNDSFFTSSSSSPEAAATTVDAGEQEDSDLSEAFKVFDEDGDGYISAKELQVVLNKLGLPEAREIERVQQMIRSVDINQDGRVDFFEFKNMMRGSLLLVPPSSS